MKLRCLVSTIIEGKSYRFDDEFEARDPRLIRGLLDSRIAEPATPPNWDAREQLRRLWVRSWRR